MHTVKHGKNRQFGGAQERFIESVREASIKEGRTFFDGKDWRCLSPNYIGINHTTKRIRVDSYYVKPVALWLPHLLVPNHVPSCPKCKKADGVDVKNIKWVASPIILYGCDSHRYLDSVYYPCLHCKSQFAGYNKQSMQLDAKQYFGLFNFHLGNRFAVDDQLYNFIVNAACSQNTQSIYSMLKQMVTDRYFVKYQEYLFAVASDRVSRQAPNVLPHDRRQPTINSVLPGPQADNNSAAVRTSLDKASTLKREIASLRSRIEQGDGNSNDICFVEVLRLKRNKNTRNPPLLGIGTAKIEMLMGYGIRSGTELLEWDGAEALGRCRDSAARTRWRRKLRNWKELIGLELVSKEEELNRLEETLAKKENDLLMETVLLQVLEEEREATPPNQQNTQPPERFERTVPVFSKKMDEPLQYNGRIISKRSIDGIVATEFKHRKRIQDAKMKGIGARILRLDFNYKLGGKIKVWKGAGDCFAPYKSIATILNEDALTVWWKALKGHESITEIKEDLIRLRRRLNRNFGVEDDAPPTEQAVRCIYIDNCCDLRNVLQEIFPEVEVKLDSFHWLVRWDEALESPTSTEAGVFKSFMRRCLFQVEKSEYQRATAVAYRKKKRKPSHKEIMKEAKAVIPCPETIRANIETFLQFAYHKDAETDYKRSVMEAANPNSRKKNQPVRFFKRDKQLVQAVIRRQMVHVDSGCLSDPTTINVTRIAPDGSRYTARSTGPNERDNRNLHTGVLTATHVGIHRAERCLYAHYERSNQRRAIQRLGQVDYGTHRSELLGLINSYARDIQYPTEPYPGLTLPAIPEESEAEFIGFEYELPSYIEDVSNPVEARNENETYEQENDNTEEQEEEMRDFLLDIDFEEDVHLLLDDQQINNVPPSTPLPTEIDELRNDPRLEEAVEKEVSRLLPASTKLETTMQAFTRLTQKQPWVPFYKKTSEKEMTNLDKAEYDFFNRHYRKYVHSTTGKFKFNDMETFWNDEVGKRFKAWSNGDKSVSLLNRKCGVYLKQHYEAVLGSHRVAEICDRDDPLMARVDNQLRATGNQLHAQEPQQTQPILYPLGFMPLGAPMPLNPEIVAGAVRTADNPTAAMPWAIQLPEARQPSQRRVFRSRMYCVVCGFKRKDHHVPEECQKKPWECYRNYCAKCGATKEHHNGPMGHLCNRPPNERCPKDDEWYQVK